MEDVKSCGACGSSSLAVVDGRIGLSACTSCGFVFYSPRPAPADIAGYYSREGKYDLWLGEERARDLLWRRRLAKLKKYKRGGALLDVGAGTGQFLSHARRDFEVAGTEISASAVRVAKERYDIDLLAGSLGDIDFGARRFDVITLFHILEHVPSPSELLDKCRRLLKEDGIIVMAVPNELGSFESIVKRAVKRLLAAVSLSAGRRYGAYGLPKLALDGSLDEIHLSFFTGATLRRLVEARGLKVVDETLDPYYAATGLGKIFHDLVYLKCLVLHKLFRINLYPAIWLVVGTFPKGTHLRAANT
jgi:ubiquinone/menaquinone biosynthesis C-methylase UbiE